MRITVDTANDALYLRLDETKIIESEEVQPGVILDYGENNVLIGVEHLNLSRQVISEITKNLHIETR